VAIRLHEPDDQGVGEIVVEAPNVARAYWRLDDAGADLRAGVFYSGDLAKMDAQGYYTVVGRRKEMIISGGENIYPAEIEHLLMSMPQIKEVAVLGVADAQWGEVLVAFVCLHQEVRDSEFRDFLAGRLAKYKWPKRFVTLPELPKTTLGKVQKRALIKMLS
jgi:fatty-acyl-CoA synthase